jgi:tetratricopeptide (TPR) repeat protein
MATTTPLDGIAARADALIRGRRYEEAVALCLKDLATRPDVVEVRLSLGRALMALHRDQEAEGHLEEALRLRPRCAEAYRALGELMFRRDQHARAMELLTEATRLAPADAASHVLLDIVREVGARTQSRSLPAAAAAKLPAAAAAARHLHSDHFPSAGAPTSPSGARGRVSLSPDDPTRMVRREEVSASIVVRLGPGLGEHLVRRGVLTRERLFRALGEHYQNGGRLGDAVVRLGYADREQVEALAAEYLALNASPPVRAAVA